MMREESREEAPRTFVGTFFAGAPSLSSLLRTCLLTAINGCPSSIKTISARCYWLSLLHAPHRGRTWPISRPTTMTCSRAARTSRPPRPSPSRRRSGASSMRSPWRAFLRRTKRRAGARELLSERHHAVRVHDAQFGRQEAARLRLVASEVRVVAVEVERLMDSVPDRHSGPCRPRMRRRRHRVQRAVVHGGRDINLGQSGERCPSFSCARTGQGSAQFSKVQRLKIKTIMNMGRRTRIAETRTQLPIYQMCPIRTCKASRD